MGTDDGITIQEVAASCTFRNRTSIGVVTSTLDFIAIFARALIKRRGGEQVMIDANAIKMALIRAKEHGWSKIKVVSTNKELVDKLKKRKKNDVILAALVDDLSHACFIFVVNQMWLIVIS
ncbi:hypothetical protein ACH5RR_007063 [Cinchona calisaya]|uniref:RNase H type-1 domain-containing protein n=1 Tax=Cinchona calisaya TaxID=153742 RepID=A0ABD3AQQ3_9GENT